ncbi:hypothetical protein D918_04061 [Trichuris suis]|nr:hypothetical protein D918_04061 [Trichuris suis]
MDHHIEQKWRRYCDSDFPRCASSLAHVCPYLTADTSIMRANA